MKSVRRACALLAVAAVIVLLYPSGAPFGNGQHGQERLAHSVSGPAPSTVESWERQRAVFAQRMKAAPGSLAIGGVTMTNCVELVQPAESLAVIVSPDGQPMLVQSGGALIIVDDAPDQAP